MPPKLIRPKAPESVKKEPQLAAPARGLFGASYRHAARDILSARFVAPPFTVLNAREGWWQERKRQWLSLGIKSELGRGENLLKFSDTVLAAQGNKKAQARRAIPGGGTGKNSVFMFRTDDGYAAGDEAQAQGTGTSIFDPVLCELVYKWFAPPNACVLDPFAGGSVRGIMASLLGHRYLGMDLRMDQVEANREQAAKLHGDIMPRWLVGDSAEISNLMDDAAPGEVGQFDLIFSCPPYGSLERYSDDPRDISTLSAEEFNEKYVAIIQESCALLGPEGFAVFVVGDYRNKQGFYENLPSVTIFAFEEAGLRLYNRAILVTSTGSLPLRVQRMFRSGRKLGTTHQDILVFAKGDPKDFVAQWPAIEEGEQ